MTSDITIAGDPLAYPQLSAHRQAQAPRRGAGRGGANLSGLAQLAITIAAARDSWAQLVQFRAERRWRHLLRQHRDHEVWLLSWLPGQRTGRHDHGGAAGVLAVAVGELTEYSAAAVGLTHDWGLDRTGRGGPGLTRALLGVSQCRVFGPHYLHEVANETDRPAVSVHVYATGGTDRRPTA